MMQDAKYRFEEFSESKQNLENHIKIIYISVLTICLIIAIVIASTCYYKLNYTTAILRMYKRLNLSPINRPESSDPNDINTAKKQNVEPLDWRQCNDDSLLDIFEDSATVSDNLSKIKQSGPYRKLQNHLQNGTMIPPESEVWKEISETVNQICPQFFLKLNRLTANQLSLSEYHTVLLIKCGISPTEMTILQSRTKGTISSRRESIGKKILGKKISVKKVDAIIRSL